MTFTHTGAPGRLPPGHTDLPRLVPRVPWTLADALAGPGPPRSLKSPTLVPQGLAVLLLFCVLDADARAAWAPACLRRKPVPEEARPVPGTVGGPQGWEASVRASLGGSPPVSPQGPGVYNNTALFEESGLIRITLGASTVSSVSSARSGRAQDQDSQRGRGCLR